MSESTEQADSALTPRWPDGQLNRFRTVGGGRIDLTPGDGVGIELNCTGCGHHESVSRFPHARQNNFIARARANRHAAFCHEIPPPPPSSRPKGPAYRSRTNPS